MIDDQVINLSRSEMIAEIRRINRLLTIAAKKAASQLVLLDKLSAAHLRSQALLRKLKRRA